MKSKMFNGASAEIFQRAKELRSQTTDAEIILWMHLRGKQLGYRFRRQHPIGNYIVDFYCHQLKLIIEADELVHNKEEVKNNDKERQTTLEGMGLKVVRFTNDEIRFNIERVLLTINSVIHECYQNIGD